jgi:ABC-type transporter Mla subunit MlaD
LSTTSPGGLPTSPNIPLSADLRAAYQSLYDTIETAIENTTDVTALQALNAQQAQIDDVLQKDAIYQLGANTEAFNALQSQINDTNAGLKTLQSQIQATAAHFQTAADILGAINKVLSFF